MEEIDQDYYSDKVKAWEESKQQKIEADDWICEYCQQINKMDLKLRMSSHCKKCDKRNENIYEMVDESIEQEKEHAKDQELYNKNRDDKAIYKSENSKIGKYYQCKYCENFQINERDTSVCENSSCVINKKKDKSSDYFEMNKLKCL